MDQVFISSMIKFNSYKPLSDSSSTGCTSESNQCIKGGTEHREGCNKYECDNGKLKVISMGTSRTLQDNLHTVLGPHLKQVLILRFWW